MTHLIFLFPLPVAKIFFPLVPRKNLLTLLMDVFSVCLLTLYSFHVL